MSDGPPNFGPLFSPDGITGIAIAVGSSLITAFHKGARGWSMFVSNVSAALVTGVTVPIAVRHGYGWDDWLGIICLACGIGSGAIFAIGLTFFDRLQSRSGAVADGVISSILGYFLPKKDGP